MSDEVIRVRTTQCTDAIGESPRAIRYSHVKNFRCVECSEVVGVDAAAPTTATTGAVWARSVPHTKQVKDAQLDGTELPLLEVQARIDALDAKVEYLISIVEALGGDA